MLWAALVPLLLVQRGYSLLVNRTIDDTNGDQLSGAVPSYTTSDTVFSWSQHTGALPADSPSYHLDPSKLNDGTWHDDVAKGGTAKITFNFVGVAIYVFFVLAVHGGDYTSVNFNLDGNDLSDASFFFNQSIPGTDPSASSVSFMYNQSILSRSSLSNSSHSLVISMAPVSGSSGPGNLALFDYAVYTQDFADPVSTTTTSTSTSSDINTSSSTSSSSSTSNTSGSNPSPSGSSSNTGPIVGGVLGGLAALAIIVLLVIFCLRKQKRERLTPSTRNNNALDMAEASADSHMHSASNNNIDQQHQPRMTIFPFINQATPGLETQTGPPGAHMHNISEDANITVSDNTSPRLAPSSVAATITSTGASSTGKSTRPPATSDPPLPQTSAPPRALPQPPQPSSQSSRIEEELAALRERVRELENQNLSPPPEYRTLVGSDLGH